MRRHTWQDWALLLALTMMWGSAFTLTKVAVTHLSPTLVVSGRLLVGSGVLLVLLLMMRRGLPTGRRRWLYFALIALLGNALPFFLISWGQQSLDSGQAGILMACMPLFTLLLAHYALPDERLTVPRLAGFLLGFAGIIVLMGPQTLSALGWGQATLVAQLAVLAGALCYAIAVILARLQPPGNAADTAAATTLLAAALTLPWLAVDADVGEQIALAAPAAWLAVVLLGVFSTATAAVVYFRLVRRAGPSFVAQLNYLIPLWAVAVGMLLLGERPTISYLYALLLIFGGIFVSHVRLVPRARADAGAPPRAAGGWAPLRVRIAAQRGER